MQILQQVRKCFNAMGFSPELDIFDRNMLTLLVPPSLAITLMWLFLFHEADGAQEKVESFHITTVCSCGFVCFISTVLFRKEFFAFFEHFDEFLNESK